jgi:hypothetical protein
MTFNIALRHYWSYAENKKFIPRTKRKLADFAGYDVNKNSSFILGMHLSYTWWFAPGSQVSVLYRNNAGAFERNINKDFRDNVTNLLTNETLSHVFYQCALFY